MEKLHTLNKTNLSACFKLCLAAIGPEDRLLLIEDGVFCGIKGSAACEEITATLGTQQVFCLQEDAMARGVADKQADFICLIDYDRFVSLTEESKTVVSWHS
ncbi:MAG: sulfurtransferase complex subunit TusB [Endozoicomonadaceae bacterium]|nr:sulfurtransferase complex subunit TusB [Endozoicomonadaceae bacterium]